MYAFYTAQLFQVEMKVPKSGEKGHILALKSPELYVMLRWEDVCIHLITFEPDKSKYG